MELKKHKINLKTYISSFLIWSGIIIGLTTIISELILSVLIYKFPNPSIHNPHDLWTPNGVWAGIWNCLSTFSLQSIIILVVYFFLVLTNRIYPNKRKFVNGSFGLAVTLYVTVTMIVFWAVLFKPNLNNYNKDTISTILFIDTFFLHLIMPVIGIMFYLVNAGSSKLTFTKNIFKYFPLTISYMFIYLGYILLKGTFVGVVVEKNGKDIIDYSFPYPFLNYKDNWTNFFEYFIAILIGFVILFIFFAAYNNIKYKLSSKKYKKHKFNFN